MKNFKCLKFDHSYHFFHSKKSFFNKAGITLRQQTSSFAFIRRKPFLPFFLQPNLFENISVNRHDPAHLSKCKHSKLY